MYRFNIVNCSQALTGPELAEAESEIGVAFPPALRAHYLKFNGGKIEGERCRFIKPVSEPKETNEFSLQEFYPIKYRVRNRQELLEGVYRMLVIDQQIIPKSYIPIGDDEGGWPICYRIDDGSIFLLYRERFDKSGKEVLVHICDSLAEFIAGMLTAEDAENMV
jgi:hypothetical protein